MKATPVVTREEARAIALNHIGKAGKADSLDGILWHLKAALLWLEDSSGASRPASVSNGRRDG